MFRRVVILFCINQVLIMSLVLRYHAFGCTLQCAEGLICFFRTGTEEVPGCSGVGDYAVDYCIIAPEVLPGVLDVDGAQTASSIAPSDVSSLEPSMDGTFNTTSLLTEGSSSDTSPDLMADEALMGPTTEPTKFDPDVVMSAFENRVDTPGSPLEKNVETPDSVLSAKEKPEDDSQLPTLELLGADGEFETYPLDICQGSCFWDSDCLEGLVCFQREGYEEVPGCAGRGQNSANYCVPDVLNALDSEPMLSNAPTLPITIAPSMTETISVSSASSHTGTTDSTIGASSNILAAFSSTEAPTIIDMIPTLANPQVVGNNNIFDVYPLTACLGDCDSDDDVSY